MEFNEEVPPKRGSVNGVKRPYNGSSAVGRASQSVMHVSNGSETASGDNRRLPAPAATHVNGHQTVRGTRSEATRHLKRVPEDQQTRDQIQIAAQALAEALPRIRPLSKDELVRFGRQLLTANDLPESYLGFAMVLIGNAFWREQFLATPFNRRLLLIPRNIGHEASCRFDAERSLSPNNPIACLACSLNQLRQQAEELGYRVQSADRSSAVLQPIFEGQVDGILGMARMDVLEKAVDKVLLAGVPSYVIPLSSESTDETGLKVDAEWHASRLSEILARHEPNQTLTTRSYLPLMRMATRLFTDDFDRLLPRSRSATPRAAASPLGLTENVAYDWLANGGKRFRPFITLAAYDAVSQPNADQEGHTDAKRFSDAICRVAMAIEAFHKASLVHDDIQDDDQFRYGRETLHRSQGLGPAINIGDYLIGLGYRLVNSCFQELGPDVAADIVQSMADAHIKLCDGQGAEMAWQLDPDWAIQPADALQIYTLKTSPAFEAALFAGLRMAGPIDRYLDVIPEFATRLGIGFQVINDLLDWQGDANNKLLAGQDALAIRPTMLLALALEAASDEQREELSEIYQSRGDDEIRLHKLRRMFVGLGAFDRAIEIVNECRSNSLSLAANVEPPPLQHLLRFLVDTVLACDATVPGREDRADVFLKLDGHWEDGHSEDGRWEDGHWEGDAPAEPRRK